MKEENRNFLLSVLRQVEDAVAARDDGLTIVTQLGRPEGEDPTPFRLSNSGKRARYLAMAKEERPQKPLLARSRLILDTGTILHDYFREVLAQSDEWDVFMNEGTVAVKTPWGADAPGHIDLVLRDRESGQIFLVDIKTVDHFGHVLNDPRNDDGNFWRRKMWTSTNYVFEAHWQWLDEPFKGQYLYQIESYREGLANTGIVCDEALFVTINRNTGHIAIGLYDPEEVNPDGLRQQRDANFQLAWESTNPLDLDPCHPADPGEAPHIECQYCSYLDECFVLSESTYRGKPKYKILELR